MFARHLFVVVLAAALTPSAAARAQDDTKEACVTAYHQAQELRLDRKLIEAVEQAKFCARDACPEVLRNDCAKWAVELHDATPTIVITATGPDGDLSDVRVFVDGQLAAQSLGGEAIALDPGRHTLRFEHRDEAPVERELLVAVGVQNRTVEVSFGVGSDADHQVDDPGAPVVGIVLGGLGVASLGVFAALASVGTSEIDELRDTCGTTQSCSEEDVDAAKTKIIVGDVFLATGVVAVGVGAVLIISHYLGGDEAEQSAFDWGVMPTPDGFHGGAILRF